MKLKRILAAAALALAIAAPAWAVNPKPFVIPELREWTGADGAFVPAAAPRVVYTDTALRAVAQRFAADWQKMFGAQMQAEYARSAKGVKDAFILSLAPDKKLGPEAYRMKADARSVSITAPQPVGAFWGTRTLLQIARQNPDLSIPCGSAVDFPDYAKRGMMLDVGRKVFPMRYLHALAEVLSFYKMNYLHVHLSDNGFVRFYEGDWDRVPAGFRIETDMHPDLTSRDGAYTKAQWRDFERKAAAEFVEVVPEIDVPAHSLAIARVRPDLASDELGRDNLDINNPRLQLFLDSLFTEYVAGPDPVFSGKRVHIGTDEFGGYTPAFRTSPNRQATIERFRALTDHLIGTLQSYGKEPVIWGSLTFAKGDTPVRTEGVLMNSWSNGYADPKEMKDLGFKLMNIPDGWVYIVPMAGYYQDYLNIEKLYNEWTPVVMGNVTFEERDPAVAGGMFAVWNDMIGNGVTVADVHHRILPAIQTLAVKTWDGANTTVPFAEFDAKRTRMPEAPGMDLLGRWNLSAKGSVLTSGANLAPNSELNLPNDRIGYGYTVEFDLEAAPEKKGTVLFSNDDTEFFISDPISGQLGFARDGYLETFRYAPRPGEKAHIRIEGDNKETALYVNGKLTDRLGVYTREFNGGKHKMPVLRTLVFPLARTGDYKSRLSGLKLHNYRLSE